jgi:hypothetical protein
MEISAVAQAKVSFFVVIVVVEFQPHGFAILLSLYAPLCFSHSHSVSVVKMSKSPVLIVVEIAMENVTGNFLFIYFLFKLDSQTHRLHNI